MTPKNSRANIEERLVGVAALPAARHQQSVKQLQENRALHRGHKVRAEHRKSPGAPWRYLGNAEHDRQMKTQLHWSESSQSLRNAGVMRPLTHDSVCLVSDTERQPTREMGRG
ncbi:unnamed protein product [Pleuronectes platessa]|uniref:Uncharacterized protein n=1 Tax=Pleuronectes platessa TaxID=8262 RepID=A0A9N7U6Q4_PLEPL|nr:unnamed protein product [Pleuronectes platessa]